MKIFGHDFEVLDDSHIEDLLQLEREGAIYTDHWFDNLNDFRHIRIKLTPDEIQEYVRSMWAFELFLRAGCPPKALDVPGIPPDVVARADSYSMYMKDDETEITPWHCAA